MAQNVRKEADPNQFRLRRMMTEEGGERRRGVSVRGTRRREGRNGRGGIGVGGTRVRIARMRRIGRGGAGVRGGVGMSVKATEAGVVVAAERAVIVKNLSAAIRVLRLEATWMKISGWRKPPQRVRSSSSQGLHMRQPMKRLRTTDTPPTLTLQHHNTT